MIISIIYLVISFLLEGIMSNIFPSTLSNISYFTTIYIIISFAIIYPYFDNDKKFFILIFIFGILFDILYTDRNKTMENHKIVLPPRLYSICCFSTISLTTTP